MAEDGNRIIVVTGAGSGIGQAVACAFAKPQAVIYVVGRRLPQLQETVAAIAQRGGQGVARRVDITDSEAVDALIGDIVQAHGRLDVLVANAGIAASAAVEDSDDALIEQIMQVNVAGTIACCRAAYRQMMQRRQGAIITIGSVVSVKGYAQQSIYGASKHAILGFTKALAVEAQPYGVRVASVLPGGVATEMVLATRPDLVGAEMIQPQDVADAVRYLVDLPPRIAIDQIAIRRWSAAP